MRWLTRLTTVAVITIIVAAVVLLIRARVPTVEVAGQFRVYAMFRDASRLAPGSPVVIAGVRVGVIEGLTIEDGLARIDMRLMDGLELPVDSFATRRADSLFGDSYIEIIPTAGDAVSTRLLKSGDRIQHVVEGGSTDAMLRAIASALPRIDSALEIVHDAAIKSRRWVSGPLEARLGDASGWLAEGHIEQPLEAADRAVRRFEAASTRGAEALAGAKPQVDGTLERFDRAILTARARIRDARVGLSDALRNTREGLDRVDPQIAKASELMSAINNGSGDDWKGTLGRLVNDPQPADSLEDVTASGRDAVASFNQFRSWLGMRVEYNVFAEAVRFYAIAELRSRSDKFYLFEFERGPLGTVPGDELSEVVGNEAYVRQQEIRDRFRFTAQFGKQFDWLSLRGGLKDSTFGFGADALMLGGRLKLSADLYGAFQTTPRLKIAGALAVFRSVYVLAGVDDVLNAPGYLSVVSGNPTAPTTFEQVRHGRDYFLGTMLSFTDEDISLLLRVYGAMLVGLL